MADASPLRLVPGFEFMQNLVKNAGAALPGIGQWVAPTLDPAELEKRINELRTVQYWLEQNARMLAATIQALEVQKMTLSTLKSMNLQMGDLRDALTLKPRSASSSSPLSMPSLSAALPGRKSAGKAAAADADEGEDADGAAEKAPGTAGRGPTGRSAKAAGARGGGDVDAKATAGTDGSAPKAVDPMQWWGALTRQFAELATSAMRDTAADAAKALAGGVVKQSIDAAASAMQGAAAAPAKKTAAKAPAKKARGGKRARSGRRPVAGGRDAASGEG